MKGKGKSRTVTTYLPPELAAKLDALIAAEGGTRSGWLRAALEACLTDLEWLRATGFPRQVALGRNFDPAEIAGRIATNRAKYGPAPLRSSSRLEKMVKTSVAALPGTTKGEAATSKVKGGKSLGVSLEPALAAWVDTLAGQEGISQSALLRGSFAKYLANRYLEAMIAENERQAAALGLTPDDVQRIIDEYRAEQRQSV